MPDRQKNIWAELTHPNPFAQTTHSPANGRVAYPAGFLPERITGIIASPFGSH